MPIIDRSEEIDIDLGVPADDSVEQVKEKPITDIPPNPIFEEMEEEELGTERAQDEQKNPLHSGYETKFRSDKEKSYYATLTDEEKEAWAGGWRGKLFRGLNKDGTSKPYKTAAEFLAFQKEHIPVLNERNRKISREKNTLENEVAELRKQIQVMLNVQKITYEKETQKSHASLDEAEEAAILEGDVAKVRAIQKQRAELVNSKEVFEERDEPKNGQQQIRPEDKRIFDEWAPDNTWFYENTSMRGYAEIYFATLSERIPLKERLEMVSEEVEERFGDKLGFSKSPKVETGVRGISSRKRQYTYSDLPAEVRKNCDFMARKHGFSKEQISRMQQDAIREYFN